MPPKVCLNKLKREMKDFTASPPPHIPAIHVNERNLLGKRKCAKQASLMPWRPSAQRRWLMDCFERAKISKSFVGFQSGTSS